jgi:urease accessory protein UreE
MTNGAKKNSATPQLFNFVFMDFEKIEIKNDRHWYLLFNVSVQVRISRAFNYFLKHSIQPILIKGWVAAQNYPNFARTFSDVDICVAPKDYEKARKILETTEGRALQVDLHKGLRHHDTLPWDDLFTNSRIIRIENTPIRILRPEDHLRVLCVHWLTDGGAYRERLWDIYYAVENRPADFDWDRFLGTVSERRKKWLLCCLGLTKTYLGLNLENTPVAGMVNNIPAWVIETVEREWADEVRLQPLQSSLHNRKILWQQIKKRIPPNPIQATVDMEGEFDDSPRIFYQIGDFVKRLYYSVRRIYFK